MSADTEEKKITLTISVARDDELLPYLKCHSLIAALWEFNNRLRAYIKYPATDEKFETLPDALVKANVCDGLREELWEILREYEVEDIVE